ncbi:hypothetical protein XELAEV_18035665mg [Xenopus laevis]|uniref:Uncharacterized protein n=1 Tax=Xenopus laevis TaxID=8355 RepID=A0A974CH76_XENLA|nr:hypothetical protein XELAEV_18035665mg [Xenopus laevis]
MRKEIKGDLCSLKVLVCMLPYYLLFPFPPLQFQPQCPFFPPKYDSIDRSTFKPLCRPVIPNQPCIPVHSIPQTAEAGSTGCLGSNRMECSVHLVA